MALRDDDSLGFADAIFNAHLRELESMRGHLGPVVFDRSLPDVVGFLEVSGLPVSNRICAACHSFRYDGLLFRAPPWQAIYRQGAQRIQDWDAAVVCDYAVTAGWHR